MIIQEECPHCLGVGVQHSPGRNGDPMDNGVPCYFCEGEGVIDVDGNEAVEDSVGDEHD